MESSWEGREEKVRKEKGMHHYRGAMEEGEEEVKPKGSSSEKTTN